jgi:dihydrofolate reductase
MLTLYNVISSDGFIAREDGREDFIPDGLWKNFLDICLQYGTLIIGRKTYDAIQCYDKKLRDPFEKLAIKKIIITRNRNLHVQNEYVVVHAPEDALKLAHDALVSSGPTLNNYLLKNHFVGKVIFHQVPAIIGTGIKPFDKNMFTLIAQPVEQNLPGVTIHEYKVQY